MLINYVKKYLSKSDLDDIRKVISEVEKKTSGELRVCIKLQRGLREKKLSTKDVALSEFYKLGMNNTRDKTGVLIFILFKERKFEIIADEGINEKISEDTWSGLSKKLVTAFSDEQYKKGMIDCINEIGDVLVKEFPIKENDVNELSDEIVIK